MKGMIIGLSIRKNAENGNIILEPLCKGRVTYNALERLYEGHIDTNSIICTDSHKSYIQFAKDLELDYKKIARGHYKLKLL